MKRKIIIIISIVAILAMTIAMPCFASISVPSGATVKSYVDDDYQNWNASIYFESSISDDPDFSSSSIIQAPTSMGTDSVVNVAKPIAYFGITPLSTYGGYMYITLNNFVDDFAIDLQNGQIVTMRFGVYTRPNTSINAQLNAINNNNDLIYTFAQANGQYISTSSGVRGYYQYFEMSFTYTSGYSDYSLQFNITPVSNGEIVFSGITPLYENSFVAITPITYQTNQDLQVPPYPSGHLFRYESQAFEDGFTYVLLGKNPTFENNNFTVDGVNYSPDLLDSITIIPNATYEKVWVYVPVGVGYGWLYEASFVDPALASQLAQYKDKPYYLYQYGYEQGYKIAYNLLDSNDQAWQEKYNELLSTKDSQMYQLGYNDGYMTNENNQKNLKVTIDSFGNLARIILASISSVSVFGVSVSVVIIGTISILCTFIILKRFKS